MFLEVVRINHKSADARRQSLALCYILNDFEIAGFRITKAFLDGKLGVTCKLASPSWSLLYRLRRGWKIGKNLKNDLFHVFGVTMSWMDPRSRIFGGSM